jgi:hypothetical protein
VAEDFENLPKRCQDAFNEINAGRSAEPQLDQCEITAKHELFRCLTEYDLDQVNHGRALPSAFEAHDMSVFVAGPDFPEFDIKTIVASKKEFVGAVKIPARTFLESSILKKLTMVHDPYKDGVGNQHPNHARIICKKGATVAKEISKSQQSFVPLADRKSLRSDTEPQ